MADRISKLPRSKKIPPIDVVRARLRNHVEVVLASNNEPLIRMVERFFSETIDRLIQARPKGEVIPIKEETPDK
jgi:phosphomannomutase